MMHLYRLALLSAFLLLAGCFMIPGKFTSTLDLRRDGHFAFAYQGEIVFQSPAEIIGDNREKATWSDDQAFCFDEAKTASMAKRSCTAAEIAKQKRDWEAEQRKSAELTAQEMKGFADAFGYTPGDEEANRRLALTIAKIDGFRSVTYQGKGVFVVDYTKAGLLDHDFVFPPLLQANVLFPFVLVRLQKDGQVRMVAPSLVAGGASGTFARMRAMRTAPLPTSRIESDRTRGTFSVTTDGEVLTNNTEDGPTTVGSRKRLQWDIGPGSVLPPDALIRLH